METFDTEKLYFFDTNAIYYFCGENADGFDIERFRNDFKSAKYKILPSCVFQEIVVKYRQNTDEIGRILNILLENDFKIAPSQYDFLGDQFAEAMLENLNVAIDEQYNKKIDNEARLIYLVIFSISMVYSRMLALYEEVENPKLFMECFVNASIKPFETKKLNDIKKRLRDAYERDDTDAEVRNIYLDYCFEYCSKVKAFSFGVNHISQDGLCHASVDEFLADPSTKKMAAYQDRFNEYLQWFSKKHKDVVEEAKVEIPDFFKEKKYTDEQCGFIRAKLERLLLNKAKLEKNDIYDMFYLFSYSDYSAQSFNAFANTSLTKSDILLVSFDTNTNKFIKTFSLASYNVAESYRIKK